MTDAEKELVRRLAEAYAVLADGGRLEEADPRTSELERRLPWREDPALAVRMQEQAWREARVRRGRGR